MRLGAILGGRGGGGRNPSAFSLSSKKWASQTLNWEPLVAWNSQCVFEKTAGALTAERESRK